MKRIVSFDLAAHTELQDILSKSKSFYEVYGSVRKSRGILGRMADDNEGDSSFWADIADLYDGRAVFDSKLIYVIDIEIKGFHSYMNYDRQYMDGKLVSTIDDAMKYSLEDINVINPKLVKFAVPVAQEVEDSVHS